MDTFCAGTGKARECIFSGALGIAAMVKMDAERLILLLYYPYTAISATEGTYSNGYAKTDKYAICKKARLFLSVGDRIILRVRTLVVANSSTEAIH